MSSDSWDRRANLPNISENEHGSLRSEADAVCQRVLYPSLPCNAGDIIQVAFGIRLFQIQCRRDDLLLHRKKNGADTGGATGSLRMSDHRLRRAQWNLPGPLSKTLFDCACLDTVIQG